MICGGETLPRSIVGDDSMIQLTLENKAFDCIVEVRCAPILPITETVTAVRIKRRRHNEMQYELIHERPISSNAELTFTYRDTTVRSHREYDYTVVPVVNGSERIGALGTVLCVYDSVYITDSTGEEWVCRFNAKYSHKRNTSVAYVKPLRGARPKAVRNGDLNYDTGSFSGLYLPVDSNGKYMDAKYIRNASQEYRERVINFLSNGRTKMLKTGEGHFWYVSIDGDVSEVESQVAGASEIQFSWTEV